MSDLPCSLQERYDRLELLYQVGNRIHATLDPQEALNLILDQAVQITKATSGSVVLINLTKNLLEVQASIGLPSEASQLKLRVGEGITGWVASTGKPARVDHVERDPRYVPVRATVQSELAVPLVEPSGSICGVLNVDSDQPAAFTEAHQDLLEVFATQAARLIHHTWLYEQLRLKARMFEGLTSVSRAINSPLSLEEALQVIVRETCSLMHAKVCSLHLLDPDRQWLDLKACFGAGPAYLQKPRLQAEESLLGIVVRRKKPIQVDNLQSSTRYQNRQVALEERLVSLLSVPLLYAGDAIGTLSVYLGDPYTFSNEEMAVVSALAELSAVAIEKARLYHRIVEVEDQLRENERLSALGLLAAEVAHEIRNPLTVLKMLFHSLKLDFPADDPRARDTRVMGEKMDQLNRIVEQILGFARHAEPKFSPVHINQVLSDLALITRHKLRAHQIELVEHLDAGVPLVQADATQLEQAFLNLILNAVQAMPQGGRLTLATASFPDHIRVSIQDTGEGMSPTQQERALSSLLSSSKKGGTGLGLALVQRIVETHRGSLQLESQLHQGTLVTIHLPRLPGTETRLESSRS